ncbi:MAG: hypothetical protein GF399_07555 [Candidatus Coatesbacteria bacterium]|nr:hypothetical protein [Candidatus Coatesbacteria bacterium]
MSKQPYRKPELASKQVFDQAVLIDCTFDPTESDNLTCIKLWPGICGPYYLAGPPDWCLPPAFGGTS